MVLHTASVPNSIRASKPSMSHVCVGMRETRGKPLLMPTQAWDMAPSIQYHITQPSDPRGKAFGGQVELLHIQQGDAVVVHLDDQARVDQPAKYAGKGFAG
jgi:hypothetical protein